LKTLLRFLGIPVVVDSIDAFYLGLYAVEYSMLGRFLVIETRNPVNLKHTTRTYYFAGDFKSQLAEFEAGMR